MGIGMALTEELAFDSKGGVNARNFDKYHMVNAPDMPEVEIMLIEDGEPGALFGAKSIGEIPTYLCQPQLSTPLTRFGTE